MKSFCKNVSPARAGTTVLKKCDAKSDLKHEKHKRGSFKLAFLMKIITIPAQNNIFASRTAGAIVFLRIAVSVRRSLLGGRAECAGVLGQQYFEEGMERNNCDRNGQKSEKSKSSYKKCSY